MCADVEGCFNTVILANALLIALCVLKDLVVNQRKLCEQNN